MQGASQLYIALKGRLTWTQAKLDGRIQPDSAQFTSTRPPTIDHSFLASSGRFPRLGALQRIACWSLLYLVLGLYTPNTSRYPWKGWWYRNLPTLGKEHNPGPTEL